MRKAAEKRIEKKTSRRGGRKRPFSKKGCKNKKKTFLRKRTFKKSSQKSKKLNKISRKTGGRKRRTRKCRRRK